MYVLGKIVTLTSRGQGKHGGGESGHAEVVSVGKVEGVVGRDVVKLNVDATLGLADMTLDDADTVVDQEPVGEAAGTGPWLEGGLKSDFRHAHLISDMTLLLVITYDT